MGTQKTVLRKCFIYTLYWEFLTFLLIACKSVYMRPEKTLQRSSQFVAVSVQNWAFVKDLVDSSEVAVAYHVQKCSTGRSVLVNIPAQGSLSAGITCVKMQNILINIISYKFKKKLDCGLNLVFGGTASFYHIF